MKLAYIIGTYPELTTTFIDREIRILREFGFNIQTLSIRQTNTSIFLDEEYKKIRKNTIYLIPIKWGRLIISQIYFGLVHPIIYTGTLLFLLTRPHPGFSLRVKTLLHFIEGVLAAYYLKDLKIDHIHAHFIDRAAIVALCASRLLKLPYSLTAHADEIFEEPILIYEKISESRFTVTVSEYNKSYLLTNYPDLDPDKIIILHPWVDINLFESTNKSVANAQLKIISVGRLVENKGHENLIKACQQLKNNGLEFECKIIGEGPLFDDLNNLIAELELVNFVKLLGGQPQSEVMIRLMDSDIFVLAAIVAASGKRDGMPVAIAEAMAMELPVISSDIVGISEMVKPSAGLLVPPNDPNALAEAIMHLWEQGPVMRQELGKEGRKIISENFDLYKGINQLSKLFLPSYSQNNAGNQK